MTTWPKMTGSETFIIVALRWTENSTSSALARAIALARNACRCADLHHGGVDDLAGQHRHDVLEHRHGAVLGLVLDAERVVGLDHRRTSRWTGSRAGPSSRRWSSSRRVHAPIEWGCLRAYCLTESAARRSELPSRSTGLTALPLTLS